MTTAQTNSEVVNQIITELKKNGFSISSVAENTGISHVRLRNAVTGKSSRFDSKEVEELQEYKTLALKLKGVA